MLAARMPQRRSQIEPTLRAISFDIDPSVDPSPIAGAAFVSVIACPNPFSSR